MFIFLSKFLPLFVYPLGIISMLLVLALFLDRKERWRRAVIGVALAIIVLTGNSWTAIGLAKSLEWRYLPPQELPQADMIVVLGGGTVSAQYPRPIVEINGAGDRMFYAAHLYYEGAAPQILLSGGGIEWLDSRQVSVAAEMFDIMKQLGIPEDDMLLQEKSQNTYEDAYYSKMILDEMGIERIILVTSATHMPRSVGIFEKMGIEVIPAPTDYIVTQAGWEDLIGSNLPAKLIAAVPNIGNVGLTTGILKEYLGMFVYHLRGWM